MNFVIIFFLVFNFLSWFHYAYCVSEELCDYLDINRFSIKGGLRQVEVK